MLEPLSDHLHLTLFGKFHLEGAQADFSLSSAQKLLALLVLRPGRDWHRDEIAEHLWPDTDAAVSRARLRTTLAHLRRSLGPSAQWAGGRDRLSVEISGLTVDLWEARSLQRRLITVLDTSEEEKALRDLAEIIAEPLLPSFGDWVDEDRLEWQGKYIQAQLRLGALAEERGDRAAAILAYDEAVKRSPTEERAWHGLLRLHAEEGRHVHITQRFAAVRHALKKSKLGSFTSDLVKFAESIRRSGYGPMPLAFSQSDMATRTLGRMLSDDPERAAHFLGSPAFRAEVFRDPAPAAELLEQVVRSTQGSSHDRMQCLVYAMMAHSMRPDYERVLELGNEVLTSDSDPARLRAAATMNASAHTSLGNWDQALTANQQAIEHAIQVGNVPGIEVAKAQRGLILMQLGQLDEAKTVILESLERLAEFDEHNAISGRAVVSLQLGTIYLLEGDLAAAESACLQSATLATTADHVTVQMNVQLIQGIVTVLRNRFSEGAALICRGLADRYRLSTSQSTISALELVTLAFCHLGLRSEASAVLMHAERWRKELRVPLSELERRFREESRERIGPVDPQVDWMALSTLREVTSAVLASLRPFLDPS